MPWSVTGPWLARAPLDHPRLVPFPSSRCNSVGSKSRQCSQRSVLRYLPSNKVSCHRERNRLNKGDAVSRFWFTRASRP